MNRKFLYIVLIFLCAAFLISDAMFFGKVFISKSSDTYFSQYSYAHFFKNMMSEGIFPLWNPFSGCGQPLAATGQSSVSITDLLYLLVLFFNVDFAWNLRMLLVFFLSGVFTYLYCLNIGQSKFAAFIAGAVFMLSAFCRSFTSAYVESSIFFLPAVLLFAEKYIKTKNNLWMSILSVTIALTYLNCNTQFFLYTGIFTFIYIALRAKPQKAILPFLVALGLSAFQFLRQAELAAYSERPTMWLTSVLLPTHILSAIFPFIFESPFRPEYNFFFTSMLNEITRKLSAQPYMYLYMPFVGVMPLALALLADRKNYYVKLYGLSGLAIMLYWMLFPVMMPIHKYIPIFNKLPAVYRLGVIYVLSLGILAGFGIDRITNKRLNLKNLTLAFSGIVVTAISFLLSIRVLLGLKREWIAGLVTSYVEKAMVGSPHHLASREFYADRITQFFDFLNSWTNIFNPSILLPLLFLVASLLTLNLYNKRAIKKSIFFIATAALVLTDLFIFEKIYMQHLATPGELVSKSAALDFLKNDKSLFRIMTVQNKADYEKQYTNRGLLVPESNLIYTVSSVETYTNLCISRYYKLFRAFTQEYGLSSESIVSVRKGNFGTEGLGVIAGIGDNLDLRLADLMNVKYFFTYGKVKMPFPAAYQDSNYIIYRNTNFLPRAFMVYDYEVISQNDRIIDELKRIKEQFNNKVILEQAPPPYVIEVKTPVRNDVHITKYSPSLVSIEVNTEKAGLLFLGDCYYPGWKAFIDNAPAKIYPADYAFRAIAVPEGSHKITFIYNPVGFTIGIIISALTFLFLVILCVKPTVAKKATS